MKERLAGSRFCGFYFACLKYSTWRSLFFAASLLLYGPPKFFPLLDVTL